MRLLPENSRPLSRGGIVEAAPSIRAGQSVPCPYDGNGEHADKNNQPDYRQRRFERQREHYRGIRFFFGGKRIAMDTATGTGGGSISATYCYAGTS